MDREAWEAAYAAFVADPEPWPFLLEWARTSECVPVYVDWTHAFGVTCHGKVLAFQHEPWPGVDGPPNGEVHELRWINVALHQGKKRHPWLASLLPARPSDAVTCATCKGTGVVPADLICWCGGAGWLTKEDAAKLARVTSG